MKFLSYNILDGGGDRLTRLVSAIAELAPDFAVLCELNGWSEQASPFGSDWHLCINEVATSPYRVGVLSRERPREVVPLCAGMNHGGLLVRFEKFDLVGVHLHPFSEEIRIAEAEAVLAAIGSDSRPVVIGGDFNSCWPDESSFDGRAGALERLIGAGFVDSCRGHKSEYSLRTNLSPGDPNWRFDFLFARGLSWKEARTLHDEKFADLSDHWPVVGTVDDLV